MNWRPKLLAISLGEVWGRPMKVIHLFFSVRPDLPSIPFIVRHNPVLSVLWYMLSTNYLHCLILWSDVPLVISSFIVDSRCEEGSCMRRSCRSSIMTRITTGLVVCIAYLFQWGYDCKHPSIVSLGTNSRLSGNQLEDDRSSACVLSLAFIRSMRLM